MKKQINFIVLCDKQSEWGGSLCDGSGNAQGWGNFWGEWTTFHPENEDEYQDNGNMWC